jgi:hypothetical protein
MIHIEDLIKMWENKIIYRASYNILSLSPENFDVNVTNSQYKN